MIQRRTSSARSVSTAFSDTSFDEAHGIRKVSFLNNIQNVISIAIILLERLITGITFVLPKSIISACTRTVRLLLNFEKTNNDAYDKLISQQDSALTNDAFLQRIEQLRTACSFEELCEINGFVSESHLVQTKDGYGLTIHRLNPETNGFKSNGKAVFLQHGLLMNSEIWCVRIRKDDNIPFRLCELGYDVFLGNNRGNKYSSYCKDADIHDKKFWNFSIDELALYDIPASIDYVLKLKSISKLTYIGFSQGCSQFLASVSVNRDLNEKIDKLILLAPATTPKKLSNWLINSIVNLQPKVFFFLFGKKILMQSILFWLKIVYPPLFIKLIDIPNRILFGWHSDNMDILQKLVAYFHLYSTTSVKCVVHWFQIIRSTKFQMYQESLLFPSFEYPIRAAMKIPKVLLVYGMADSLVDIDVILHQLPEYDSADVEYLDSDDTSGNDEKDEIKLQDDLSGKEGLESSGDQVDITEDNIKVNEAESRMLDSADMGHKSIHIVGVKNHEHLDLIWGNKVENKIIQRVVNFVVN